MPVCSGAITQLVHGAGPLADVPVGARLDHPVTGTVRGLVESRGQPIEIHTAEGPTLVCTAGTMLRSPGGWVRVADASELVIMGYPVRVGTGGDPLTRTDASLAREVRDAVIDEVPAQLELILRTAPAARARVQRCLLALGIRAATYSVDRLRLRSAAALDYVARVGTRRESVAAHLTAGESLGEVPVPVAVQTEIARLLGAQGLSDHLAHPAEIHELQELSATCLAHELITTEAARMIELLRPLPVHDLYLRSRLLEILRAQVGSIWTVRVTGKGRGTRGSLMGIVGVDYLADGFVVRGSRAPG